MSESIWMKQRVNITPQILENWQKEFKRQTSAIISKFLLKEKHLGQKIPFIEEDESVRYFTIMGMTDQEHIILEEELNGTIFYWECTYQLTQFKLGLYNKSYEEREDSVEIPYTDSQLHLNTRNRKTRIVKADSDNIEDLVKELDPNSLFEDDDETK